MADPSTPVPVVAAALIAPDGRICLQRRPFAKMHGGLWEFPGGKVEPGETPEIALQREVAEELGAVLELAALRPAGHAGNAAISITLFACRRWTGAIRCLEAEAIGWFEPAEISRLAMPPLDYPLAAGLEKLIGTGAI